MPQKGAFVKLWGWAAPDRGPQSPPDAFFGGIDRYRSATSPTERTV